MHTALYHHNDNTTILQQYYIISIYIKILYLAIIHCSLKVDILCDLDQDWLEILEVIQHCASILAQPRMLQKSLGLSMEWFNGFSTKALQTKGITTYFRKPSNDLLTSWGRSPRLAFVGCGSQNRSLRRTEPYGHSQEAVYRSAAVHRRQPSYKKLRASFEVSCSWDQSTSDFRFSPTVECCAESISQKLNCTSWTYMNWALSAYLSLYQLKPISARWMSTRFSHFGHLLFPFSTEYKQVS